MGLRTVKVYADGHLGNGVNSEYHGCRYLSQFSHDCDIILQRNDLKERARNFMVGKAGWFRAEETAPMGMSGA